MVRNEPAGRLPRYGSARTLTGLEASRLSEQQTMQAKKPRVLLAARPGAREPFRQALGSDVEVVEAETLEQAVAELSAEEPPNLVCCTVYFDDSRMFDLVQCVRERFSHIPIVCARALPKDLAKISMQALRIASDAMGAAAFVDLPTLAERYGDAGARAQLRVLLLGQLARGA
jgi:hypothetical protein